MSSHMIYFFLLAFFALPIYGQQWQYISPMEESRASFQAIELNNGLILVTGGRGSGTVRNSTELYDPSRNTWTGGGDMLIQRQNFPLVKLFDGKLFVASGLISNGTDMTNICEIYDPATNSWKRTADILEVREGSDAILLPTGKVLIVAGDDAPPGNYRKTCELFDPITETMTFTGSISQGQFGNVMFLESSGKKVTMVSDHFDGANGTWLDETEEYDIATGKWQVVANSSTPHGSWMQQAVQLPNGEIVAPSGGKAPNTASSLVEIYNPRTKTWRVAGTLPHPRYLAASVYLGGDSIMVIGGFEPSTRKALRECTIFNLVTGESRDGPLLNERRYFHRTAVVRRHDIENPCCDELRIFVFGGEDETGKDLASCEALNMRSSAESPLDFSPSLILEGSVCEGIDTAIKFKNTGCSTIIVDSIKAEGFEATTTGFPMIVQLDKEVAAPLSISSDAGGVVNGRVRIYYRSSCSRLDTSIAVTANFAASTKGSIRPIISDVPNGGSTVEMPLYLVNNSGDLFNAFEIALGYNKNLLEALPPRFDGTLAEGAPRADITSTASGATIYVPQTISLSVSKPLCILRFTSQVPDTACTTVRLEGVRLEDGNGNSCVYTVKKDSALICKTLSAVRAFDDRSSCAPHIGDLTYDHNAGHLRFTADACTQYVSIGLYDMLGKPAMQGHAVATGIEQMLDLSILPSGIYSLVAHNSYGSGHTKVLITR